MFFKKRIFKEYTAIITGSLLSAFVVQAFIIPSKLGSGGITGISLVLHQLFSLPVGTLYLIFNIPLIILAFLKLGKNYTIKTLVSVVISSAAMDVIAKFCTFPAMNDKLLAALFAGAISGIASSFILLGGGSGGGLDITAQILDKKLDGKSISNLYIIQDSFVYLFVGIVIGPSAIMYALIVSFVRSKTVDVLFNGLSSTKQCIIICDNAADIASGIMNTLNRGATILEAKGGYTDATKQFVFVVIQNHEVNALKKLVKQIDTNSFITISNVNYTIGNFTNKNFIS